MIWHIHFFVCFAVLTWWSRCSKSRWAASQTVPGWRRVRLLAASLLHRPRGLELKAQDLIFKGHFSSDFESWNVNQNQWNQNPFLQKKQGKSTFYQADLFPATWFIWSFLLVRPSTKNGHLIRRIDGFSNLRSTSLAWSFWRTTPTRRVCWSFAPPLGQGLTFPDQKLVEMPKNNSRFEEKKRPRLHAGVALSETCLWTEKNTTSFGSFLRDVRSLNVCRQEGYGSINHIADIYAKPLIIIMNQYVPISYCT